MGGSLLDTGMDLYHREKNAMEEMSTVNAWVMIFQFVFSLCLTGVYAYFLMPFQYKKWHVGTPGNLCFAMATSPDMKSTIEQAYSPLNYTNGTVQIDQKTMVGPSGDTYDNVSLWYSGTLLLLASGQALYTLFTVANNGLLMCLGDFGSWGKYSMTGLYAVIQSYRLAGFVALVGSAFAPQTAVCRGLHLNKFPDIKSVSEQFIDAKKANFIYYWAIVCIVVLVVYVALLVLVFVLVGYEKAEDLQNCLVFVLKYWTPSLVKRVR